MFLLMQPRMLLVLFATKTHYWIVKMMKDANPFIQRKINHQELLKTPKSTITASSVKLIVYHVGQASHW